METRDIIRPLIVGLVGIGTFIIIIVLIVKLVGGGSPATPSIDLAPYANTAASATLLIDSPTNIDQDHKQIRITVSQTQNQIELIQGYQGSVIEGRTYPNNSEAFGVFVQSLKLLNYSAGNTSKDLADYRGFCPRGNRYVFSFNGDNRQLFSYWSSTCGQGTFKGNRGATLDLFKRQIPAKDFSLLTGSVPTGF